MCNNGFCGNNCLWIIILLILFCGCGNNMCGSTYSGSGNSCGCERHTDCCC